MTKKSTRLPKTVAAAALFVLFAGGPPVFAQNAGTAAGNRAPQAGPPSASSPQTPSTETGSASPPAGAGGLTVGRVPGHTGQISTVEPKPDPVVEQTEKEVSRRINNICRGC
jgi:hypothetical protein